MTAAGAPPFLLVFNGADDWRFLFEMIKDADCELYVVSSPMPAWMGDYVSEDRRLELDAHDPDRLVDAVTLWSAALRVEFAGVGTVTEDLLLATSELASAFGVRGLGAGAARRTSLNKLLMRMMCQRAGIDRPRFAALATLDADGLRDALEDVGLPAVLKPLGGLSSIGVRKIETAADVEDVVASEAGTADAQAAEHLHADQGWLLEEYVEGRLISVDGIVQDGKVHTAEALCEVLLGPEPLFTLEGVRVPARVSADERAACTRYIERVIAAVGMNDCAFHGELRLGADGPALVEIAGRMPGQALVYQAAQALNFGAVLVDLWLGRPVVVPQDIQAHVIGGSLFPPEAGRLTRLDGVDALAELPGIWWASATAAVGDTVSAYPDEPTPLVVYAGGGPTPEAAEELARRAEQAVHVDISPTPRPAP